jgi:hypothetical protein
MGILYGKGFEPVLDKELRSGLEKAGINSMKVVTIGADNEARLRRLGNEMKDDSSKERAEEVAIEDACACKKWEGGFERITRLLHK